MDLNWNGRDITIERRTKGRSIFGEFKAFETATGLPVQELTAANCGEQLLGVEKNVFIRAGFLRLSDLPVTQDEALRRRLNALVTTGDESGAGDKLEKTLKDLKNKCRYNRSGLIPQAEAQRDELQAQLDELRELTAQSQDLAGRIAQQEARIAQLENHKTALRYEASKADAERVCAALRDAEEAEQVYHGMQASCDGMPSMEQAQQSMRTGTALQQQSRDLQLEEKMLPALPQEPPVPAHFAAISPADAEAAVAADLDALSALQEKLRRKSKLFTAITIVCILGAIALAAAFMFLQPDTTLMLLIGAGLLVGLMCAVIGSIRLSGTRSRKVSEIHARYPGLSPDKWRSEAATYAEAHRAYETANAQALALRADLDSRLADMQEKVAAFAGDDALEKCLEHWQQIISAHLALEDAGRTARQARSHAEALAAVAKPAEAPKTPSPLTYTDQETDAQLYSARFELRQMQLRLGQYQGRCEALGNENALKDQLKAVKRRLQQLEDTHEALDLAQRALSAAKTELQRRFAPRISKRAQELFSKLTGGRYDRLTLSEDLSLNVGANQEDTLRSSLWRSDGTVDQLYLALRLAVAEELTPQAPLILDDALVRFDDTRMASAMDILCETAQNKQVILFTCQSREAGYMGGNT